MRAATAQKTVMKQLDVTASLAFDDLGDDETFRLQLGAASRI
ncbi:hypothetical protein WME91_38770 [Sorangium sp. So ce269]